MPAKPRIPSERILDAIREWGGNVSATAAALGMHPKNLRERLARLDVDLDAIRTSAYRATTARVERFGVPGVVRHSAAGTYGQKSTGDTLAQGRRAPIVSAVQSAMVKDENEVAALPVRTTGGNAKTARIKPAYQERLREAKVDLIGRFRIDTDEQTVFDQFFEEAFDAWLRSKLEPAASEPRRRKRGDDEGGGR